MSTSPRPATSTGVKVALAVLFVLVLISLALNLYLVQQLTAARNQAATALKGVQPQISEAFSEIDSELENLQSTSLQFSIDVNQQVPIAAQVPFNEAIEIPVQVTIPIQEEFATTIMVDPFGSGFTVPMDVVVPIDMEFPIDQVVPITVEKSVDISTTVPLSLTVPLEIDIEDTDLAPYINRLREGLGNFEQALNKSLSAVE